MCTVNLVEIYYSTFREYGKQEAKQKLSLILNMPIKIIDVDINLTLEAAEVKANYAIALGDCFAIGLTKLKNT